MRHAWGPLRVTGGGVGYQICTECDLIGVPRFVVAYVQRQWQRNVGQPTFPEPIGGPGQQKEPVPTEEDP